MNVLQAVEPNKYMNSTRARFIIPLCSLSVWLTVGGHVFAQQVADTKFNVAVSNPAYADKHPRMLFDEAHFNVHTASGGYKPFADLVSNDGCKVTPNPKPFNAAVLAGADILVIANARGAARPSELPAFTEAECDAVRDWVRDGGTLLLVTDHYPIGYANENLAKRFDVDLSRGTTMDAAHAAPGAGGPSALLFDRTNQLLGDHAITRGRDEAERIKQVVTFTGLSLKGPEGSTALLKLSDSATDRMPSPTVPGQPGLPQARRRAQGAATNEPQVSAAGRSQGLAMKFGKGRVVVLGEASELSAQRAGPQARAMGMNFPGCDNRQFALNIIHWLSGLTD